MIIRDLAKGTDLVSQNAGLSMTPASTLKCLTAAAAMLDTRMPGCFVTTASTDGPVDIYVYRVTGISYTTHLIDSVAVVDSVINNIDMERFKVFFRIAEPETPEEPDEPENPENPENPETPENPENPEEPENPENPVTPAAGERRIAL